MMTRAKLSSRVRVRALSLVTMACTAHHESEDHRAEDHRAEDHRAEDHRAEDHRAEDHRAEDQFASLHRAEDQRAEDQRAEDNPLPSLTQPSPVQVVPIHWPPDQAVNDVEACHHAGAFQGFPWMSNSPEITLPSAPNGTSAPRAASSSPCPVAGAND